MMDSDRSRRGEAGLAQDARDRGSVEGPQTSSSLRSLPNGEDSFGYRKSLPSPQLRLLG